ncbi:MAG: tRNA uridine-5-carboxymethylaminomethyl(34) synthesis enzyme MnmG [Phycisphaeraceae bacterium]|nr:MAG: tRNA uridine-5-carboxymethylaminomethyl(34) synthesis enzyme MnmG [Phycisphaeraceae bacterium]
MREREYQVIVIGGGHAGVEAAWAAANILDAPGTVALVTTDPSTIGVMSCNPAIGGLAKGQLVREIDALNGLMGLAADATGIQFKVLNASKGEAVHGPRAQCDKHAYAREVRRLIAGRPEIKIVGATVEGFVVRGGEVVGVEVVTAGGERVCLRGRAVVLTTGTFMRGLMHVGDVRRPGGRHGESAPGAVASALMGLGLELGRLKTGTPPRLDRRSIEWDALEPALGDEAPVPFSDLSMSGLGHPLAASGARFPVLEQVGCRQTRTTAAGHELIRANLHRAPMFTGQITGVGPRYCPSIEDKVVRFADRDSHPVFLEPESLTDDWVYCNGISTSLPAEVQEAVVRSMPGCANAVILRHGYAVEYDVVRPHQIEASGAVKDAGGLYLAGQINGTSGYEEAAAQGVVAGINAARRSLGLAGWVPGRDQAYAGVLMDDLVTKTPVEPYRMFTSRAEHRLVLRSDNAAERLTGVAKDLGLLTGSLGRARHERFEARRAVIEEVVRAAGSVREGGVTLARAARRADFSVDDFRRGVASVDAGLVSRAEGLRVMGTVFAGLRYEPYVERSASEARRRAELEHRGLPAELDAEVLRPLRAEAREALARFRPRTFGQAARLEGITPADLTLLAVLVSKRPPRAGLAGAGA